MIENKNLKIFTDNIEPSALEQCYEIQKAGIFGNNPIRVMPDVHAGKGCVIGFTAPIADKVVPNIVGVDIGCGMYVLPLGKEQIDFEQLDGVIRRYVPAGHAVASIPSDWARGHIQTLRCVKQLQNLDHLARSVGTLGGGNHFIEVDKDEEGNYYLIIHSGSRNLGKQVADIYQRQAIAYCNDISSDIAAEIERLKASNRYREISGAIARLKEQHPKTPQHLAYLVGQERENYLHDMYACQEFASRNRLFIAAMIVLQMGWSVEIMKEGFHVVHNYIDADSGMVRKGAISAKKGEKVLIPLNMRDGCILGVGKGNKDWNESAPHGAGRILSRGAAKQLIDLDEYQESMKGIYTTSVGAATLDEAPQAYKPAEEIVSLIGDTVEIQAILKPVYNFKAGN